jgi:hypothetical protein
MVLTRKAGLCLPSRFLRIFHGYWEWSLTVPAIFGKSNIRQQTGLSEGRSLSNWIQFDDISSPERSPFASLLGGAAVGGWKTPLGSLHIRLRETTADFGTKKPPLELEWTRSEP